MNKLRLFTLFFGLIVFGYASAFWGAAPTAKSTSGYYNWGVGSTASLPFAAVVNTGNLYGSSSDLVIVGKPINKMMWLLSISDNYGEFTKRLVAANEPVPNEEWYNNASGIMQKEGVVACDSSVTNYEGALVCVKKSTSTGFMATASEDYGDSVLDAVNKIPAPQFVQQ